MFSVRLSEIMEKNQLLELYLWDIKKALCEPSRDTLRKARHRFYAKWKRMPTHIGIRTEDEQEWMEEMGLVCEIMDERSPTPAHFFLWREVSNEQSCV